MGLFPAAAIALLAGYHPPEPPPPEYVFVRDTARRVGFYRQRVEYIGRLDADGNFHVEKRFSIDKPGSRRMGTYTRIGKRGPAYEYRAGTLVKGVISGDGVFVPDPEAPAVPFWQYKYSPTAIPIWNLPGTFQKKDPPGGPKAEKK
jgi:hypothetical protein